MPFSAHASAFAILAFADGGSRNSSLHPPLEALGISTLAQGSRERAPSPSVRHKGAEAAAAASHRITKVRVAVKPADGGLPSSVTVQRKSAAPRHLPQGEGKGGCRRRAQNLPKCKPQLSPPGRAALIRRGAAQRRTAPPSPRGRQGRLSPQSADIAAVRTAAALPQAEQRLFFPKEKAFSRINSRFLLHRGVYSVIIHLIIRKMRRKDYLYERKEKTPRRPL